MYHVGIDMVKNYCLYKWYGRCSAKKGQKLSQITPNGSSTIAIHETTHENLLSFLHNDIHCICFVSVLFFFFFFFSSSKLQREQHNAWTQGLHHSKAYLPEMFPGSLNGCV